MHRRVARTVPGNTTLEETQSSEFLSPNNLGLKHDMLTALKYIKHCCKERLNS